MAKTTELENSAINILDSGTVIRGDLESTGRLRIDGKIIGSINSKEKIILGQTGYVEGEIHCKNAELSGKVKGKVVVEELLSIQASARLDGDVFTKKLAIESGAVFNATCQMTENPSSANNKEHKTDEKQSEQKQQQQKQTI
ncbi:MAG: polymer-forming cytoskeletal protein [Bacteroidales bacterium]|nr:polymer-forming cytoskeletal protein [Bacteroidales bacterium]MCF8326888.1 polymer-forming cytoskeletal protein [Bacteroidales bacterium]